MTEINKHGLKRRPPAEVRREVRKRSKFGCVVCRSGFYEYEHIDPQFHDAKEHNPDHICCLCESCHGRVSRGQMSKLAVRTAYDMLQKQSPEEAGPPTGPLDFIDGRAELLIGGLVYNPAVRTLLKYHGENIISLLPGEKAGEPGRISASFTDDRGIETLRLDENEWVGSLDSWDIEVVGPRLTVRREKGSIALILRLDPPGVVVVERLDMRIGSGHILCTDKNWAVGRHCSEELIYWATASIEISTASPAGVAIEFTEPEELAQRHAHFQGMGQSMAIPGGQFAISSHAGLLLIPSGVAIASLCGCFSIGQTAVGPRALSDMRRVIVSHPSRLAEFIGTGLMPG
jgi:hypothetical protein